MQDARSLEIFESTYSPTAEFGERDAFMAQLEGQETKHAVKTGCLTKLARAKIYKSLFMLLSSL